jgi:phosphatidate cytidylyltransferase
MPSARRPPFDRQQGGAGRGAGRSGGRIETQRPPTRPPVRRRREPRSSDLGARIAIAIPLAFLAVWMISLGGLVFALFLVVIGWLCMHELYRLLARWHPITLVGFAALGGMVVAARYGHQRDVLEIAVAAVPVVFVGAVMRGRGGMTVSIAGTLLGIYWIGFAFAHAELLRQLPHGNGVLIDVLVGTFLGDTGAYAGGRLFGRRPLAPQISPHKTVEGLVCGAIVTILAVIVAGAYQTWLSQSDALALGAAIAVLGPLGDLFESVVKRDAGTKDAGTAFGAHGGALDRLDAVIFTVVAGYYIWLALVG